MLGPTEMTTCSCGLEDKIKAKIEELEQILKDNPQIEYGRRWVLVSVAIPALQELLAKEKEDSK